jgi:uncharacterized protein YeaO (DUF488 family)
MLVTAQTKDTVRHRGTLLDVTHSSFAPSPPLRRELAQGTIDDDTFAERYALELRQQWAANPLPFREVIDRAKAGDVTLVDSWGAGAHVPRRVLASVLAKVARGRL